MFSHKWPDVVSCTILSELSSLTRDRPDVVFIGGHPKCRHPVGGVGRESAGWWPSGRARDVLGELGYALYCQIQMGCGEWQRAAVPAEGTSDHVWDSA